MAQKMEVISVAFPFCPMTDEILKKFSKATQDSNQTIDSPKFPAEFASQEFQPVLELNPQHSETDQSDIHNNNQY
jgi:hypothetical protein